MLINPCTKEINLLVKLAIMCKSIKGKVMLENIIFILLIVVFIGFGIVLMIEEKKSMPESAKKIKALSKREYKELEGTLSDGL